MSVFSLWRWEKKYILVEKYLFFVINHFSSEIMSIYYSELGGDRFLRFHFSTAERNWVFATNFDILIPISLEPDVKYFR